MSEDFDPGIELTDPLILAIACVAKVVALGCRFWVLRCENPKWLQVYVRLDGMIVSCASAEVLADRSAIEMEGIKTVDSYCRKGIGTAVLFLLWKLSDCREIDPGNQTESGAKVVARTRREMAVYRGG